MAEKIDDITIDYFQDDVQVVKEVDKVVLTRGSWTTIMFLYQDLDNNTSEFGPSKVSIRRYQKRNGAFRQQSKFNISSAKQAKSISDVLLKWFETDEVPGSEEVEKDSE